MGRTPLIEEGRTPSHASREHRAPAAAQPPPRPRRAATRLRAALLAADLSALAAGWAIARAGEAPQPADAALLAVLALWALAGAAAGLYDRAAAAAPLARGARLAALLTAAAWLDVVARAVAGADDLGAGRVVLWWAVAGGLALALRAALAVAARRAVPARRVLVVGSGRIAEQVARRIRRHPEAGLEHVGTVAPPADEPSLVGVARALAADRVVVATPEAPATEVVAAVRALGDLGVDVQVAPPLDETVGYRVAVERLETVALLDVRTARPGRSDLVAKRALDLAVAGSALVVLAPLLLAIALLIKLESRGPVLFRQTRLGMGMRPFTTLKFRTMRVGTPADEHRAYIHATLRGEAAPQPNGLHKLERGSETTRIGRRLRRTSLDELPQLLNVVRGDMSLVGPRPCIPYEVDGFAPHHFERFRVPAGLTGLWQVTARSRSTFAEALDIDVAYARGHSLAGDLWILLRTPAAMAQRRVTA